MVRRTRRPGIFAAMTGKGKSGSTGDGCGSKDSWPVVGVEVESPKNREMGRLLPVEVDPHRTMYWWHIC